jgi:hypothetical protein
VKERKLVMMKATEENITAYKAPSWVPAGDVNLLSSVFAETVSLKSAPAEPKTPEAIAKEKAMLVQMDTGQTPTEHVQELFAFRAKSNLRGTTRNNMQYETNVVDGNIHIRGINNDSKIIVKIDESGRNPMMSNISISGVIDPHLARQVKGDIGRLLSDMGIDTKLEINDRGRIQYGTRGTINTDQGNFFGKKEKHFKADADGKAMADKVIRKIAGEEFDKIRPGLGRDLGIEETSVKLEPWMEEIMKTKIVPGHHSDLSVSGDLGPMMEALGANSPKATLPLKWTPNTKLKVTGLANA